MGNTVNIICYMDKQNTQDNVIFNSISKSLPLNAFLYNRVLTGVINCPCLLYMVKNTRTDKTTTLNYVWRYIMQVEETNLIWRDYSARTCYYQVIKKKTIPLLDILYCCTINPLLISWLIRQLYKMQILLIHRPMKYWIIFPSTLIVTHCFLTK